MKSFMHIQALLKVQIIYSISRVQMGNAVRSNEDLLYLHLYRGELVKIQLLLQKDPALLEKPITKDTKHTLLMRAAFMGNLQNVKFVLGKQPQVNAATPKGQTALSIAVKKNKLEIVKLLVEHGADVNFKNQLDLSIIDLAILPGYLDIASFLYERIADKEFKYPEQYEEIAKKYQYRYVNYNVFLATLAKNSEDEEDSGKVEDFLIKKTIKLIDPVPDPRESWKEWLTRNIDFKEAPLVERSQLPENLQPQNRKLGKLDVMWTNWSRIDGRKKTHLHPQDKRQVMSEMADINTNDALSDDPREYQSAA